MPTCPALPCAAPRRHRRKTLAELKILVGFDEDLTAEATRLSNPIRGLLTQIHSALKRVIGPRLTAKQGLAVIERPGDP